MAKRKSSKSSGMSLWTILLVIVFLSVVVFLATRLINSCSDCEKNFVGLGYEGNVLDSIVEDDEQILCEDCAERHHALNLLGGKELENYKRVLVPGRLIPGEIKW